MSADKVERGCVSKVGLVAHPLLQINTGDDEEKFLCMKQINWTGGYLTSEIIDNNGSIGCVIRTSFVPRRRTLGKRGKTLGSRGKTLDRRGKTLGKLARKATKFSCRVVGSTCSREVSEAGRNSERKSNKIIAIMNNKGGPECDNDDNNNKPPGKKVTEDNQEERGRWADNINCETDAGRGNEDDVVLDTEWSAPTESPISYHSEEEARLLEMGNQLADEMEEEQERNNDERLRVVLDLSLIHI